MLFVGRRTQDPIFATGGDTTMIGWLLGYGTEVANQEFDGDEAFLNGWVSGMVQAVKE